MPAEMTHWERVRAALKGEAVDRVPVSLWRYFPVEDDTPEGLAAAHLRWQRDYDFDLLKVTPNYTFEDWGRRNSYSPNELGVRTVVQYPVGRAEQWPTLKSLDVTRGEHGGYVTAIRLISEQLQSGVPILQTVQSPLTTALKLTGDRLFTDLRTQPELLREGLLIIAETMARFAVESVRAGAHGIFFATHMATYRLLSRAEYLEYSEPYDRIVLDAVRGSAEIILAHAHGEDIMLDVVANYPIDALNWHDRLTEPALKEGMQRFSGLLAGGISERRTLLKGPVAAVQAEVRDAIAQTGGRRLMIAPGCVVPVNTPPENLRAAREAVEID